MSKVYVIVGYIEKQETSPGIWENAITEQRYRGDFVRNKTMWQQSGTLNDDLNISSEISILADAYAYNHFSSIRYVEFMGAKWKVLSASPERPRITLTLGGLYNEQ